MKSPQLFSTELQSWLNSSKQKSLNGLVAVFAEKSFAVALLLLLFPSALPLPTGGVTNALEIIALLVSVQLIAGRTSFWIPQRWNDIELGQFGRSKVMPRLISLLRWGDRFSRHNLGHYIQEGIWLRIIGVCMSLFTLGAFLAPPFSGLDTLPSIGVVLVSLAILVEDRFILLGGVLIGFTGIAINILSIRILIEKFL